MKYFSFCLLIISSYAITCPNMCSGHGSCSSGVCLCSSGFTGGDCSLRQCARDVPYTDPNGELTAADRTALECSGQGKCNRVSGLCECFSGYEGAACQRQKCPNNCNNHGVCTPVNLLKLEDRELDEAYYDNGYWDVKAASNAEKKDYKYWDADHSFSCVCDKEWSGYDCSKRKCLSGYSAVSDCDSEAQTTQTIGFDAGDGDDTKIGASKNFYIEYTDQMGRKWYTDLILAANTDTAANAAKAIKSALQKLPPGVIDLDSVTQNAASDAIIVRFGKHQTGKQVPMRAIGINSLNNDKAEFGEQKSAPGYHGMYADGDGATLPNTATFTVVGGIAPLVCGGNGICDTDTGVCECFDNYYGLACTEQKELI